MKFLHIVLTSTPFWALICQAAWFGNDTKSLHEKDTVTIHREIPIPTSTVQHIATTTRHHITTATPFVKTYALKEEEDLDDIDDASILLKRIVVDITVQNGTFVFEPNTAFSLLPESTFPLMVFCFGVLYAMH